MYRDRRRKLLEESDADCVVLINVEGSSRPSLLYYTGFSGTFATLVLFKNGEFLITDPRYTQQAKSQTGMDIVEYRAQKKFYEFLVDVLSDIECERIGLEKGRVTLNYLDEVFSKLGAEIVGVDGVVRSQRRVKTNEELGKIEKAIEIAEKAFLDTLDVIKPGMTEREIAAYLEYRMKVHGAERAGFDTIVASGYRSAMPHGVASEKIVEPGDVIVFDFGAVYDGYHSDITRMVVLGEPGDLYTKVHGIVLKAQKEVFKGAKPGMKGKEIDALARDLIEEEGYGKEFGHGLGHGIGLEVHEGPRVSRLSEEEIGIGEVFTVEPGIYLEGEFGVRVEDDVVMEEDGLRILTHIDRDPFIVG